MPRLSFEVLEAAPAAHALTPTLQFRIAIRQAPPQRPIAGLSLQCQLRIAVRRRLYAPGEKPRLSDLFGSAARWGSSLQDLLWTHVNLPVRPFRHECEVQLPVACSFDFELASTKYFAGLETGSVPLLFLFSGSVFYRDANDMLTMELLPWDREAEFRLPVSVWCALRDRYYPGGAWLRLDRDTFAALDAYKRERCLTGWSAAVAALLADRRRELTP